MQNRIVFLVENDSDLRRAMGLLLEKWGISVLDAASGEEALDLIEELGILPDCFIVDFNLGDGMDGLQFLAEMRARHGPVPARIVTADRRPEIRTACAEAGLGLMIKPFDPRALESFIAGLPAAG
jgi:DNA-binding response OmpR family regulator